MSSLAGRPALAGDGRSSRRVAVDQPARASAAWPRPSDASGHADSAEAFQIGRQTYEIPLTAGLRLSAHAEPSEAEHVFDPPDHGFDDRFAAAIAGTSRVAGEPIRH